MTNPLHTDSPYTETMAKCLFAAFAAQRNSTETWEESSQSYRDVLLTFAESKTEGESIDQLCEIITSSENLTSEGIELLEGSIIQVLADNTLDSKTEARIIQQLQKAINSLRQRPFSPTEISDAEVDATFASHQADESSNNHSPETDLDDDDDFDLRNEGGNETSSVFEPYVVEEPDEDALAELELAEAD